MYYINSAAVHTTGDFKKHISKQYTTEMRMFLHLHNAAHVRGPLPRSVG